jgi:hypothetical protein
MKDGHLNKCKECTKKDVKLRYNKDREKIMRYERKRSQEPSRREKWIVYQREGRKRNPDKNRARAKVDRAIRLGKLIRQPCSVCGSVCDVEAHHTDYSKPFEITWLCFRCHRIAHGQMPSKLADVSASAMSLPF